MTADTPTDDARDPLEHRASDLARIADLTGVRVQARHIPFLTQINVRIDPAEAEAGRTPWPLPLEPTTAWEDGDRAALWLGPDEWLLIGPPSTTPQIVAEWESLDQPPEALPTTAVDVSAARVVLELEGLGRHALLAASVPLDLHPSHWTRGSCAGTLLGKTQVILHERTAASATRILVPRSYADAVLDRLLADTR